MSLEVLNVDPPFSFFQFSERFGSPNPLRRILSLMRRNNCRTIVVNEKPLTNFTENDKKKLSELGHELKSRKKHELLFFKNSEVLLENLLNCKENFLGFATICIDELKDGTNISFVMNSVTLQPYSEDKFLTCNSNCVFNFQAAELPINGIYFAQQHGKLNVCAHTAIKMALEGLKKFKSTIPSIYEINAVLNKINYKDKIFDGLTNKEIVTVIKKFGCHCYTFDFSDSQRAFPHINYQQMAYYSIESGFPVIISFSLGRERHVITAVGHTFNSDTWSPLADLDYFNVNDNVGYL